jgi:hypothetical protein
LKISRLESVPLRELWRHEEQDFSSWLFANIEVLGDALQMQFSEPQKEVSAGSFTVDLVVEEENRGRIIIENQLEATDHDHLGKLLTYLTNLDAKTAIWITPKPRPEHARAIAWLNETTSEDVSFYLVQLSAYRIGDSAPAPLFTVITGPSAEGKAFGSQKKQLAERHVLRLKFWEGLLERAKALGVLTHAQRSAGKESWIGGASGRSGLSFNYVVWMDDEAAAELYIDTGDATVNTRIFNNLLAKKIEVESAFGGKLDWEPLDDRRACRIRFTQRLGGLSAGESRWPEIWDPLIDAMRRLVEALKPHIKAA